jgi:hypothetical protein
LAEHVYDAGGPGLYLHPDSPMLASSTSEVMPDGTEIDVSCYAIGSEEGG